MQAERMARSRLSASWRPNGAVPLAQLVCARLTAMASPGQGSIGSTGASVPKGMTAPAALRDRQA